MKQLYKVIISLVLVASSLGLSQVAHATEQGDEVSIRHNVDPAILKSVDSSSRERFVSLSLNDLYEEIGSLTAQRKRICGERQNGQNLADSQRIIDQAWNLSSDSKEISSQSQEYKDANLHYQKGGVCWTAYKQAFDAQVIYAERAHQQAMASAVQNRKPTSFRQ